MPEPRAATAVDAHIGRRIRARRRQLRLSQQALAGRLGITFQQLQKYERAANRVSAARLVAIAAALEAPPAWFLPFEAGGRGRKTAFVPVRLEASIEAIGHLIAGQMEGIAALERLRDDLMTEQSVREDGR